MARRRPGHQLELMVTKQRAANPKTALNRVNFVSDTISELKKVTWLSRREVIYLSGLVLLVTVVVGVFLALVDFGFTRLVESVFLGR
jgi:preprotein translocase subunit SecE